MAIDGISKLTKEQRDLMFAVNELHEKCVGNEYKTGMKITKVWIDDSNTVCVKLLNGEWYHYTSNQKWY